jgi:hypothetical protein
MLIQDQVTVFQWLLYIKYGGPRLARRDFAILLRHSSAKRLPTPGLYQQPRCVLGYTT